MRRALWLVPVGLAALAWGFGLRPAGAADSDKKDEGKGAVVELDGLSSRTPASWKEEEPSNQMRLAQFKLPKVKDDKEDAQVIIFKGISGSAQQNIERWKGQFQPPEGKTIDDIAKVKEMKVGDATVSYLDIHGTYLDKFPPFAPNAKVIKRPGYRMLAVQFEAKSNPYHIKLTGPADTVEHYKQGFDDWLQNFK
jgi:hypothetical protein